LVLIALIAGLAYFLQRSVNLVAFVVLALLLVVNLGYWQASMETLSLVICATLVCLLVGIPIGIAAAHRPWLEASLRPLLDLMQTIPTFVYLIPTLILFGLGVVPGLISIAAGLLFARVAPPEAAAPARKAGTSVHLPRGLAIRTFVVMVASATTGSLLFNFTTNGNAQMMAERLDGLVSDPAALGMLLALLYGVASLAQLVVGQLVDRVAVKPLFMAILGLQILFFALAAQSSGWAWYVLAIACMVMVFGAIPFNDVMVARYIDDSLRSRVSGTRIAISFGISSLAVAALGPAVKAAGFTQLWLVMSGIAVVSLAIVAWLPGEKVLKAAMAR
jgi:predicted MFS family arabinose efflux permease